MSSRRRLPRSTTPIEQTSRRLRFQPVAASERPGAVQILSGAHQLRNLPDVTEVVQRPFVKHLIQRDLPGLLVQRHPAAGLGRQIAQVFDVAFALLLDWGVTLAERRLLVWQPRGGETEKM